MRRIELPVAAAKKVDELLPFEVESLIPFEAEETLLDYQAIENGDASKLRMLVCAAPKDRIAERLRVLEGEGLDPVSLIPSAPALAGLSAFIPALASGTQMVLFISFDSTEVCMMQKGRPELARTIPGGIRCLDEVSFGEPTQGTDAERYARELKQTITSYRMQGGAEPERVFVSGALDATGMTSRWVAQALKREAEDIVLPDVPSANGKGFEALDPALKARFALPLALVGHTLAKGRYIDLRKNEFARKRNVGFIREFAPLLGVAGATVFLAWGFSIYAHYSVLQARREALEAELAQVSQTYLGEETHTVADARRLLEEGRAHPDPMPQWTALDALLEVSNAIPEDITHDVQRMQIDLAQDRSEGHFELQGVVGTVDETERIRTALAGIACFQNLQHSGATTPAADGRRQYRLEADVRCPNEVRGSGYRTSSPPIGWRWSVRDQAGRQLMRARLEATWAGFNDREKKLVGLMMSVFAICVVVVPMYMLNRAIASLETENDAIVTVIDEIHAASPRLAAREAAARAAEARYNVQAPALASLVEAQSHEFQVTFNAVTNQPEVQQGRFRRRHVRASFPATGLRAVVKLMNSLEASQYPIGLERIHFDHFAPGEDRYNVELGVITYDRQATDPAAAPAARPLPAGQAGPPTP